MDDPISQGSSGWFDLTSMCKRPKINNNSEKHPNQVRAKGVIVEKNGGFDSVTI